MSITANDDRLEGQRLIMFMIMGLVGLKGPQGVRSSEKELSTEEKNTSIIIKVINPQLVTHKQQHTLHNQT